MLSLAQAVIDAPPKTVNVPTGLDVVINSGDMGIVIAFVLMIGAIVKSFTPIANKWIPLITWVMGGLLYQSLAGGWTDVRQWMMALLSVAGATGLYSATSSTFRPTEETEKKPPSSPTAPITAMFLIAAILGTVALASVALTGCQSPPQRIAYNSLATVQTVTVGTYDGYVAQVIAGRIPTNDLPKVSRQFNVFQASFLVALDAVEYNTNAIAPANITTLSGDLINLITTLTPKSK